MMTTDQFQKLLKFLKKDQYTHLKAHGSWPMDAEKLIEALEAAGVETEPGDKSIPWTIICAADVKLSCPKYPRTVSRGKVLHLQLADGREYEIPEDPIRVFGLLHHLSGKVWANHSFFHWAIQRIAKARKWEIH